MALQLRRGTDAERLQFTPLAGELIYTTDTKEVYIGDGSTVGGKAVTAFTQSDAEFVVKTLFETQEKIENLTLSKIEDVSFSLPLVAGQVLKFDGAAWSNFEAGLSNILEDATPTLGGNLDLNSKNITGNGNININGTIQVSSSATLHNVNIYSTSEKIGTGLSVFSITNGNDSFPGWIDSIISKGTWENPVNPEAGEFLGGYKISAYINNSSKPVALLASELDSTADLQSFIPASNFFIGVTTNTDVVRFKFSSNGSFEAPIIKAANYETTNLPATPEKGYIVFDSTSNQFKGWNGTAWVVLG